MPTNQAPDNLCDEIKVQQENVKWATHIIVVGPIWFWRFPACFYAYGERVFTMGFGYNDQKKFADGLFADKKLAVIITAGAPPMVFDPKTGDGLDAYLQTVTYVFRLTGMKIAHAVGLYGANSPNRVQEHNQWIEKLKEVILKIDQWKEIPADMLRYQTLALMPAETLDTIVQ